MRVLERDEAADYMSFRDEERRTSSVHGQTDSSKKELGDGEGVGGGGVGERQQERHMRATQWARAAADKGWS